MGNWATMQYTDVRVGLVFSLFTCQFYRGFTYTYPSFSLTKGINYNQTLSHTPLSPLRFSLLSLKTQICTYIVGVQPRLFSAPLRPSAGLQVGPATQGAGKLLAINQATR